MHLRKSQPGEETKEENVFEGIIEVPLWRRMMEMVVYAAAIATIMDILVRILSG